MLRKSYVSPEFEWLRVNLLADVLSGVSLPPVPDNSENVDDLFEDDEDPTGDTQPGTAGDEVEDF